jgi:hypothetical protein
MRRNATDSRGAHDDISNNDARSHPSRITLVRGPPPTPGCTTNARIDPTTNEAELPPLLDCPDGYNGPDGCKSARNGKRR